MKPRHYLFLLLVITFLACSQDTNTETTSNITMPPSASSAAEQAVMDQKAIMSYLKTNGKSMSITPSGIHYEITNGAKSKNATLGSGEEVVAHYHGTFLDGKVFDSSVEKGRPFSFAIGSVIPAWREAIRMMEVGDKGTFIIPSHLAYGPKGYPGLIDPSTILKFEIELLGIKGQ